MSDRIIGPYYDFVKNTILKADHLNEMQLKLNEKHFTNKIRTQEKLLYNYETFETKETAQATITPQQDNTFVHLLDTPLTEEDLQHTSLQILETSMFGMSFSVKDFIKTIDNEDILAYHTFVENILFGVCVVKNPIEEDSSQIFTNSIMVNGTEYNAEIELHHQGIYAYCIGVDILPNFIFYYPTVTEVDFGAQADANETNPFSPSYINNLPGGKIKTVPYKYPPINLPIDTFDYQETTGWITGFPLEIPIPAEMLDNAETMNIKINGLHFNNLTKSSYMMGTGYIFGNKSYLDLVTPGIVVAIMSVEGVTMMQMICITSEPLLEENIINFELNISICNTIKTNALSTIPWSSISNAPIHAFKHGQTLLACPISLSKHMPIATIPLTLDIKAMPEGSYLAIVDDVILVGIARDTGRLEFYMDLDDSNSTPVAYITWTYGGPMLYVSSEELISTLPEIPQDYYLQLVYGGPDMLYGILPTYDSTTDEGKILKIVNGMPAWVNA